MLRIKPMSVNGAREYEIGGERGGCGAVRMLRWEDERDQRSMMERWDNLRVFNIRVADL